MKVVAERHARLFKHGKSQALRIPLEFELPGDEAVIRKAGNRLIIEPTRKKSLLKLLETWASSDETLPDVDKALLSLDNVALSE